MHTTVTHWLSVFCMALSLLIIPGSLWAQQPSAPKSPTRKSSLILKWIDAKGNLYPGGRVEKMEWVWSRYSLNDLVESPALRMQISSRLPADWVVKSAVGDGITVVENPSPGETQRMTVDVRTASASLRMTFQDAKGQVAEMTLAVEVTVPKPYVLIRPECSKYDLKFIAHKAESRHLYVGLSCNDVGDGFELFFFRSTDSKWNHDDGLVDFDEKDELTAFKYFVAKPKSQTVYSQKLFRVGTVDEAGRKTEYSVFYTPKITPSRFYASAGLGMTYYQYTETLFDIKKVQFSPTGKVNVGVRIIPRVLDVAFNGFLTLFPIYHSPSSLPFARFYGLNGRLGYRLPIGIGATEFMFLTGWYFWGMIVNANNIDQQYGINSLNGPQIFINMVHSQAGHAGWWTYLKLAMITDQFRLTAFGNREIALGAGLELSPRETKPFAITLDVAQAQFSTVDASNAMKLLSFTLGLQKSL